MSRAILKKVAGVQAQRVPQHALSPARWQSTNTHLSIVWELWVQDWTTFLSHNHYFKIQT